MSPLEILARQLDDNAVNTISQRIGASPQQTQAATAGVVQTLMGAMARGVQQQPQRAQSIERALDRDNHAALLDNLGSILGGGGGSAVNSRSMNGMGILRHISRQPNRARSRPGGTFYWTQLWPNRTTHGHARAPRDGCTRQITSVIRCQRRWRWYRPVF